MFDYQHELNLKHFLTCFYYNIFKKLYLVWRIRIDTCELTNGNYLAVIWMIIFRSLTVGQLDLTKWFRNNKLKNLLNRPVRLLNRLHIQTKKNDIVGLPRITSELCLRFVENFGGVYQFAFIWHNRCVSQCSMCAQVSSK